MEIMGTIIIVLIFVGSYVLFSHKKKKENEKDECEKEVFYKQLDKQINEQLSRQHVAVWAGGDKNNEINVSEAIAAVFIPEGKRIRL